MVHFFLSAKYSKQTDYVSPRETVKAVLLVQGLTYASFVDAVLYISCYICHVVKGINWIMAPLLNLAFLAGTKQFMNGYFRLSVCPSVIPFWQCSCHCIIVKFSGVIANDKSDVYAKGQGQGQKSKVKVTEVNTQLGRFRTVTRVWIHIWWWNDAQSLMLLRRGALLFFKFIRQVSRSHVDFDPNWAFPDCNSSLNLLMATKWCIKLEVV